MRRATTTRVKEYRTLEALNMEQLRESFPMWFENRYVAAAVIIVASIIAAAIVDFIDLAAE